MVKSEMRKTKIRRKVEYIGGGGRGEDDNEHEEKGINHKNEGEKE